MHVLYCIFCEKFAVKSEHNNFRDGCKSLCKIPLEMAVSLFAKYL